MPVTRETIRLVDGLRISLGRSVDDVTRSLVGAWSRAWDVLAVQWQQAVDDAVAHAEDGRWPSRAAIDSLDRAQRAFDATRAQVMALSDLAGVTVVQILPGIASSTADWHKAVILSELPDADHTRGGVGVTYNRVDTQALDNIVKRTTDDIASYMRPLSADAEEQMKRTLIRGVALGDNPRTAARLMVRDLEGDFNGGLARALNIARTEMLDVSRLATQQADLANPKLVTGWYWWADLDERTCASCWSQHGSFHPADEQGPDDHQSGRCSRVPATPSWADLGFSNIPEPAPIMSDAEATFNALPEAKQLAIMGPARLDLLKSGDVKWADLSVKRSSEAWRDSYAPRPVKELLKAS